MVSEVPCDAHLGCPGQCVREDGGQSEGQGYRCTTVEAGSRSMDLNELSQGMKMDREK